MLKRVAFCGVVILVVAGLSLAGQQPNAGQQPSSGQQSSASQQQSAGKQSSAGQQSASSSEGSWTGWVTDSVCGAKGAKASHTDCAAKCVKEKGAKWALYNSADQKVYILDPQDGAAEHAAHHVKVKGTLDGDTIHVSSYKMIGSKKGSSSDSSKSKS
jgi:hypothetical protein